MASSESPRSAQNQMVLSLRLFDSDTGLPEVIPAQAGIQCEYGAAIRALSMEA